MSSVSENRPGKMGEPGSFPKASYCNVTKLQRNTRWVILQMTSTTNGNTPLCKEKLLWFAERQEATENLASYGFVLAVEMAYYGGYIKPYFLRYWTKKLTEFLF